jgi:Xaa-Pro aminopeptidase
MISFRTSAPDFNSYLDEIESIGSGGISLSSRSPEYAEFSLDEYRQRYARLSALAQREGLDAVLATQEENVRYFTGYLSVLWISKFRPYVGILPTDTSRPAGLIVPSQERGNAEVSSWVESPTMYPAQEPPVPYIVQALRDRHLDRGRIGIELGFGYRLGMNQEQFQQLVELLPDVEFVDATPIMQAVRMLKSDAEVDRLLRAAEISEAGVRAGWEALRPGLTEREILAIMGSKMYAEGAEVGTKPSFFGILAGDRWRLANAVASDYAVKPGDIILVDGGASYRGYTADFIRQASIGRPTPAQKEWFDAAVAANNETIAALAPGVPAYEVYEAALSALARYGLAQRNRMNIVGHGIGMDIHEVPWIGQRDTVYTSNTKIRAGMVVCIEPGVSAAQQDGGEPRGTFIVEDTLAVTKTGTRLLTHTLPKTLWISE